MGRSADADYGKVTCDEVACCVNCLASTTPSAFTRRRPSARAAITRTCSCLLDDSLVARVDLKADRQSGVLRVQGAWLEPEVTTQPSRVGSELVAELRRLTQWLGLQEITVEPTGDLSPELARFVGR